MIYYVGGIPYNSEYLEHHGILGMKWGIRRYQNSDGTLTRAGINRYREYRDGNRSGGIGRRIMNNLIGRSIDTGSRGTQLMRKAGALKRAFGEQRAANNLRKGLLDTAANIKNGIFDNLNVAKRHTQWRDDKEAAGAGIFGSGLDKFVKDFGKMSAKELDEVFDAQKRDSTFKNLLKNFSDRKVSELQKDGHHFRSTVDRGRSFITSLFDNQIGSELRRNSMTVNRNDSHWDDPKYKNFRMGYSWRE